MGFSFWRSSSFGPFRFNFSKSGIGASVGVKGARVTLSPKGKAYITVGAGGFSYRQNLSPSERASTNQPRFQPVPEGESLDIVHALTVLGLTPGVTSEQVTSAFRRMAQMYHPDKTVGLGPELQKLADERMKEINAAQQAVKRFFEHA